MKHLSDKGLIFRICKEVLKFNNKETAQLRNGQKICTNTSTNGK